MKLIRYAIAVLLALVAARNALAQQALEIIPLRHRTVEQVLPTLRPLLEPGGALTGQSGQLIVRTSPGNLADIRAALAAIDRPLRRLMVSVRFDDSRQSASQGIEASGRIGGPGTRVEISAHDSARRADEHVDQRLQVVEGGQAFISSGRSRPVPQRQVIRTPTGVITQQTTVIQEAATGFSVVPRVSGNIVQLDVMPQQESFGPGGAVRGGYVSTSVTARLGEWVEVGGSAREGARDDRGLASSASARASGEQRVWIKVEDMRAGEGGAGVGGN
jgi:hypothetical protein